MRRPGLLFRVDCGKYVIWWSERLCNFVLLRQFALRFKINVCSVTTLWFVLGKFSKNATTAPSTVAASWNAMGPSIYDVQKGRGQDHVDACGQGRGKKPNFLVDVVNGWAIQDQSVMWLRKDTNWWWSNLIYEVVGKKITHSARNYIRAEPILGSVTRFGRVSDTRQYSVLGRHKPADTEY